MVKGLFVEGVRQTDSCGENWLNTTSLLLTVRLLSPTYAGMVACPSITGVKTVLAEAQSFAGCCLLFLLFSLPLVGVLKNRPPGRIHGCPKRTHGSFGKIRLGIGMHPGSDGLTAPLTERCFLSVTGRKSWR